MSKQDVKSYIWDEVESLPRPEMEKLQVERLRAGIDRVSKTVPFYKKKLSEAGVTADSIRSLEDLDRLPFTTKADLRDNYPFGLVAVPMKEVIRAARFQWNDGQADGGGVHAQRYYALV